MPVPQEGRSAKPNGLKAPCEQAEFPPTGPRLQRLEPSIPDVNPFIQQPARTIRIFSSGTYLRRVAALTRLTKDLVCSVRSSAASALPTCDWDTSAPFLGYSTLSPGAHTTFKLSGFQPFQCVPLSLTIYSRRRLGLEHRRRSKFLCARATENGKGSRWIRRATPYPLADGEPATGAGDPRRLTALRAYEGYAAAGPLGRQHVHCGMALGALH